jgi:hypothetical protein
MSGFRSTFYKDDGQIRGHYVYLLLCQDSGGPIYVKIGVSISPLERFAQIKANCAVTPKRFAVVELRSRKEAYRLESELLDAYKDWRAVGEWLILNAEDKAVFNAIWKLVFERFAQKGWPLRWTQLSAQALIKASQMRQRYAILKIKRRGKAYADFLKDAPRPARA